MNLCIFLFCISDACWGCMLVRCLSAPLSLSLERERLSREKCPPTYLLTYYICLSYVSFRHFFKLSLVPLLCHFRVLLSQCLVLGARARLGIDWEGVWVLAGRSFAKISLIRIMNHFNLF